MARPMFKMNPNYMLGRNLSISLPAGESKVPEMCSYYIHIFSLYSQMMFQVIPKM